jgi:MoxR-like ATPase
MPAVPERVPVGYLGDPDQLPQQTVQLLRWMIQKSALGEDVFLLGPPGPSRRHAALCFAELFKREVEVVSISADTTEADLKQRREIVGGDAIFIDQAPVRAALHGRLLLLEGIERAERNVLPTLNNLLEAREMALEDGRTIVSATTWDKMIADNGLSEVELTARGLCRAHPDFMAIAIGLPVPPFAGRPLDPPLRSRFQGVASGPADAAVLLDAISSAAPGLRVETAASLVEFSEAVFSLARSGAAGEGGGGGGGGGSSGENSGGLAGPRASLAFEQGRVIDAAKTLEAFPGTAAADALRRVLPALSGVGADSVVGAAMRSSADIVVSQRGSTYPGYEVASISAYSEGREQQLAAINFDVLQSGDGSTNGRVSMPLAAGPRLLQRIESSGEELGPTGRPLSEGLEAVQREREYVALAEPHGRVLSEMMQDWSMGRDLLVLGPKGAGKSRLVIELCNRLGWDTQSIKVFPLFRDVSARDLLQTRDTTSDGDTVWVDSPLVAAAKAGTPIVLDNLHAARADVLLGSLARLLVDRELELPDGTLLKAAERMATIEDGDASNHSDSASSRPTVVEIPAGFRVLGLGTTTERRNPLAPEVASLFSLHQLEPLSHAQMGELASVLYPGANRATVEQLCAFGEKLAKTVAAQRAKLSDTEAHSLQLSLRLFCRLCRFLETFPEAGSAELIPYIHDGMLTPFMPESTCLMVNDVLVDAGLLEAAAEGDEEDHAAPYMPGFDGRDEAEAERLKLNTISEDAAGAWLHVGGQSVQVATPDRPELVPAAVNFFGNAAHDRLLGTMLQAHAAGERALLLIGSQGVGKNRLADKLIAMLGREREYIQLHRDSTLTSLTLVPSLEDGQIVWQDSPLVRAARHGRILLVDEADKAPLEVVALLKQLVEDGSVLLGNGQRLSRGYPSSSSPSGAEDGVITIHPEFAVWVLANPAGFPFLGNDLFSQCGDVFRTVVVSNPDRASEVQILMEYAPNVALTTLSRLAAAFGELREMNARGQLTYPYSLREAVATAKHLNEYPTTPIGAALSGVLSFDSFDARLVAQLVVVFKKHDIDLGVEVDDVLRVRFERMDGSAVPKTKASGPKHGKVDPDNKPHVGGNTWAGGTGGSDTAGLGGRGGPYRLDAGHPVHQLSDDLKQQVLSEAQRRAKEMGRAAMAEKLREIGMGQHEWDQYEQIYHRVAPAVSQLRQLFASMETKRKERAWAKRQTSGELDDNMLVDGKAGERLVFKRRTEVEELDSPEGKRQRLRLIVDVSGSMTRFNGLDGRLNRTLEAVMVVMEALAGQEHRIDASIQAHSGDSPDIPLVDWDAMPTNRAQRLAVLQAMVTHSAYCWSGDNTVEGITAGVRGASERGAALGDEAGTSFVLALSDANLRRYGIAPEELSAALTSEPGVEAFVVLIGGLGNEASDVAARVKGGRAVVCEDTSGLPALVSEFLRRAAR